MSMHKSRRTNQIRTRAASVEMLLKFGDCTIIASFTYYDSIGIIVVSSFDTILIENHTYYCE